MSPDAIRLFLMLFAFGIAIKATMAPRRGTFLTLFGVVERRCRPRLFRVCLIASYALAAMSLVSALFLRELLGL